MGRSIAFNALQRLAREHLVAAAGGVSVDNARGMEAERMSRGDFGRLVLGGAAGALLSPAFTYGTSFARSRERIAIVGAGMAGIACALGLHDAGIPATIFESSNRIGGRMHSNWSYWNEGQHTEWCGAMVDSKHLTIHALARRFHLPLVDTFAPIPNGARDTSFFNGRYYRMSDADRDFAPVFRALTQQLTQTGEGPTYNSFTAAAQHFDRMSMAQWIDRYVPGGHTSRFGQLIADAYMNEYGVATDQQSSLNMICMLGVQHEYGASGRDLNVLGYSDQRYFISGGNQRLPLAVAKSLPSGTIRFGYRLMAIRRISSSGAYELRFSTPHGDVKETYDRVVLTIPFVILRGIDYADAGFDSRKKLAITQLGYGIHTKLHMQFNGRPWKGKGTWPSPTTGQIWTDTGFQNSIDFSLGQQGSNGIIERFTGLTAGLIDTPPMPYAKIGDSPAVERHVRDFFQQLDRIWPGVSQHWNGKATFGNAQADPNIQASYSCWLTGQYTTIAGYEGVRQGNVHFAGEHCSVEHQGFMEGAAETGLAAAREILNEYNVRSRAG